MAWLVGTYCRVRKLTGKMRKTGGRQCFSRHVRNRARHPERREWEGGRERGDQRRGGREGNARREETAKQTEIACKERAIARSEPRPGAPSSRCRAQLAAADPARRGKKNQRAVMRQLGVDSARAAGLPWSAPRWGPPTSSKTTTTRAATSLGSDSDDYDEGHITG